MNKSELEIFIQEKIYLDKNLLIINSNERETIGLFGTKLLSLENNSLEIQANYVYYSHIPSINNKIDYSFEKNFKSFIFIPDFDYLTILPLEEDGRDPYDIIMDNFGYHIMKILKHK